MQPGGISPERDEIRQGSRSVSAQPGPSLTSRVPSSRAGPSFVARRVTHDPSLPAPRSWPRAYAWGSAMAPRLRLAFCHGPALTLGVLPWPRAYAWGSAMAPRLRLGFCHGPALTLGVLPWPRAYAWRSAMAPRLRLGCDQWAAAHGRGRNSPRRLRDYPDARCRRTRCSAAPPRACRPQASGRS